MRRRAKPARAEVEAKPPVSRKSPKNNDAKARDLEKRLAESLEREAGALAREAEALGKLQTRDRDLTEALEQQTATAQVLELIARSPGDLQPTFDGIVQRARRLCDGLFSVLYGVHGELVTIEADDHVTPENRQLQRSRFPMAVNANAIVRRVFLEHRVVHVEDAAADPHFQQIPFRQAVGYRTLLLVPMLREGAVIGAIGVARVEPGGFTDKQVRLLQTFADQAVIAIEHVRLFKELQEKNQALTEAHAQVSESLEQQTATSEILRVIASSPTDVQPVFDVIARNAVALCDGFFSVVGVSDGRLVHLRANHNLPEEWANQARAVYPLPLSSKVGTATVIRERRLLHVLDAQKDGVDDGSRQRARTAGYRTWLGVPMLGPSGAIGVLAVARREKAAFTDKQVALLQTFADQAVIAIENVRLFKELQEKNQALTQAHAQVSESLEQQTATSEVLKVISRSAFDLQPVLDTLIENAVRLCGADRGFIHRQDGEFYPVAASYGHTPEWLEVVKRNPIRLNRTSATGRAALERRVIHIPDILADPEYRWAENQRGQEQMHRTVLSVPMLREGAVIGVITIRRPDVQPFTDTQVELVATFADQAVIAIENVRLFKELEAANRELATASQHKSEFLANMSHELRTPLNAIIGFSEVLSDRMFGELNEKQEEYLKDIYASGTHLLSLINDILDLSKIEAGRMELELTDFDLPTALDNALMLVHERAQRRSLTLHKDVDGGVGQIQGDERKIRQVVLNLLSNAIKFTPEGGRIEVAAVPKDGCVEVSVSDTGVGIAPEDQEKVFEEFRQVGTADKKAEGTGLGLTLCRKFIELHGGRIWVKSDPGVGSTFTFTIPVRHGE